VRRSIAEAATIAIVAAALGVVGSVIGLLGWGLLAGALVWLAVGLTIKMYYFTILGAPVGLAAGATLEGILWAAGLNPQAMLPVMTVLSILAAVMGGSNLAYARRNTWEKLRPFLGAVGGLLFGAFGALVGVGLQVWIAAMVR
jgi:hypothetical protein